MTPQGTKTQWKHFEKEKHEKEASSKKKKEAITISFLATVEACCRGCSDVATAEHATTCDPALERKPSGDQQRVEVWKPLTAFLPMAFENPAGTQRKAQEIWDQTFAKGQELEVRPVEDDGTKDERVHSMLRMRLH